MKIRIFFFVLLSFIGNIKSFAQINTPSTCKVPFGILAQSSGIPYMYGLIPSTLPAGTYKYLSTTQCGKSQDAYTAYIGWKERFIEDCGGGAIRVKFDDPTKTVSEGIAYGMLLSAYAADKVLFDGLYNYYKANSNANGVMNWRRIGCTNTGDYGGATDAELDAAMALIIAENQWPTINTPYDYTLEATALINAIKTKEIHPTSFQTINGDGWGFGDPCRNPSYFSPAYYRAFAKQVPEDSAYWAVSVANASYTFLNKNANATSGLVGNWADPAGNSNGCNGPNEYGYDACRYPWRMATDVLWHNDSNAKNLLTKTTNWLKNSSATCKGPIAQNATSPSSGSYHNALFTSTYAVATMGGGDQALLDKFYTETVKLTDAGYFGNTIRTIMLFMLSGNFWEPNPKISYVELTSFTATEVSAGKVAVQFTSSVELGNVHYNLYVSNDQVTYTLVTKLPGLTNSSTPVGYAYNEERYINEVIYYKLTYTDIFGREIELKTAVQYREDIIAATLSPNPYTDEQTIYLSTPDNTPVHARIVDMKGKTILDKKDFPVNEEYKHQLDLADGMYLFMVQYGKKSYSFKIQKR